MVDAYHYGFDGTNQTTSIFTINSTAHSLSAPTLNITTSYAPSNFTILAYTFTGFPNGDKSVLDQVIDSPDLVHWIYNNQTYGLPYVLQEGACLPNSSHNWGFSFLILFIVILLTLLWAVGMYALWLDAYLHSRLDHHGRKMGIYRASFDFAEAMRKDISPQTRITEAMSDQEIQANVAKGHHGRRVAYNLQDPVLPLSRWEELKHWWTDQMSRNGHRDDAKSACPTSHVEQEKGLLSSVRDSGSVFIWCSPSPAVAHEPEDGGIFAFGSPPSVTSPSLASPKSHSRW